MASWDIVVAVHHHKPLPRLLAAFVRCGVVLAAFGHARIGAGLIVQQERGHRPGELLGLLREEAVLPTGDGLGTTSIILNLGVKTGTKNNRPQAVTVSPELHPSVACAVDSSCGYAPPHPPGNPCSAP